MSKDKSSDFLKAHQRFEIVTVVGQDKIRLMAEAALSGSAEAIRLANAMGHWLQNVEGAQAGKFRCLACDLTFKYPEVKARGFAICEANNQFLVSGVCETCAVRGSNYIQEVAMMKLQSISEPGTLIVRDDEEEQSKGKPQ